MRDDNKPPGEISRGGETIEKTKIYIKNPRYYSAENMMVKIFTIILSIVFVAFFAFHAILGVGVGKAGRKVIENEKDVSIEDFLKQKDVQ